jgi:D-arabinose 1-dehydrogenase-like Zn-dependent alcohol dehydrogenase
MTRLLTLVVLGLALAVTLAEAKSKRIHVIAEVVKQTITGDQVGDQIITTVVLRDQDNDTLEVGTGAGACTIVSVLPADPLVQCLLTAVFPEGQIIFGGIAPPPEVDAMARFGILGGTGDFRKARGEAILFVRTLTLQDATFDLD